MRFTAPVFETGPLPIQVQLSECQPRDLNSPRLGECPRQDSNLQPFPF